MNASRIFCSYKGQLEPNKLKQRRHHMLFYMHVQKHRNKHSHTLNERYSRQTIWMAMFWVFLSNFLIRLEKWTNRHINNSFNRTVIFLCSDILLCQSSKLYTLVKCERIIFFLRLIFAHIYRIFRLRFFSPLFGHGMQSANELQSNSTMWACPLNIMVILENSEHMYKLFEIAIPMRTDTLLDG